MSFERIISENKNWIEQTWKKIDKKLSVTAIKSRDKIPYTSINGVHDDHSQGERILLWTNGFWGGLMWLMYSETKKECYKITAENSEKLMDGAFSYMADLYHDVGFMWHILSGANYRITGNTQARNRNLLAAMTLMSRYNVDGNYIRAWNGKWDGENNDGWTIIDCLMNLSILYWASKEIGDDRFKKIAMRHADMAMRDHVRADGSVNHIVVHDTEKADTVIETKAGQGYAVGSSWSRGVAWALYGFVISYIHTKEQKYMDTAKKVAHYFIANVANTDWLPLLDFRAPETPVYYDSTAGAIAACGLIEMAKHCSEFERDTYLQSALKKIGAIGPRTRTAFYKWEVNAIRAAYINRLYMVTTIS